MKDRTRSLVAACLFLSGAGSLMLEVVWTRLLRLTFGSTTLAVSTVLVAYMLGLGLGGLLGGRLARRLRNGVRAYGQMEIAIALYAACVPWLIDALPSLTGGWLAELSFWPAALVRFAVILIFLLLPTVFMGATLPVLVAALVRGRAELARSVGLLYGVNTLGAVTGVLASTFLLFPLFGLRATNAIGAALDLAVGLLAIATIAPRLDRSAAAQPTADRGSGGGAEAAPFTRWNPALLSYGTVGFTALVYEVCWTRALAMILGSSIYAFSTMLAAFLAGIALGSLVARRWFDGLKRPLAVYAVGLALLGVLSLLTLLAFRALPDMFIAMVGLLGVSRPAIVFTSVLVSMLAMAAPTLVLGALFPLLVRALVGSDNSRTVGDVYFVNTIGSAAGAFSAGFLLIPALGLRDTMAVAMAINFAAAAAVLLWQKQWLGTMRTGLAAAAVGVAGLLLVVPPNWNEAGLARGVYRFPGDQLDVGIKILPLEGVPADELLFYREGINTTVSVHRSQGEVNLRVNGKADASSGGDLSTQVLLGQIPLLFGKPAESVLVIGLASGMTVGSVATHEPRRVDVIELEPAMIEASRFFDDVNGVPLEKPFVRVIADDGRVFLANAREQYDVIVSEPSNPWITGASNLFTREFFHAARRALVPGGRLCQWVQLYGIDPPRLRAIIAALRAEFPYAYGFLDRADETDLILLASDRPLTASDLPRWEDLTNPVRDDLRRIGTFSTADLWSLLRLNPGDVDVIAGEAEVVNTDDNMEVELETPWRLWDFDVFPDNQAVISRHRDGILGIAESGGNALDGTMVGQLALAFAGAREDQAMAKELSRLARQRGDDVYADLAEVRLEIHPEEVPAAEIVSRLRAAAVARPDSFDAHLLFAGVLSSTAEFSEALVEADTALRLQPGDPRARMIRLEALLGLERGVEARAEAEGLMKTALRRDRELAPYAAAAAADSGRVGEGIREMKAAIERFPAVPLYWTLLGQMYLMIGQNEQAKVAQANAARAERNLVLLLHQTALRDERLFGKERAVEGLTLTLALDPSYEPARADLKRLGVDPAPPAAPTP